MEDDKFLAKLLTRDASTNSSTSTIFYYGHDTGSVPFLWESRPGIPKHLGDFPDNPLPPLTPPPSYFMSPRSRLLLTPDRNPNVKKQPKLFGSLLAKLGLSSPMRRSRHISPGASSPFSSYSPSSASSSSRSLGSRGRKRSCMKLQSLEFDDRNEEFMRSPRSITGYGHSRKSKLASGTRLFPGCYAVPSVKNKILSFVGQGHDQGYGSVYRALPF